MDASFLSRYPILFLDDEIEGIKPLLSTLARRGFCVESVASSEEALRLLDKKRFAVVVSDHRMPHTTGVAFLTQLAETKPTIIRILLTAYTDHATAVQAINSGQVFRYIMKSGQTTEIAKILEEAVLHFARLEDEAGRTESARDLDRAEAALNVLRDVRYDWGNIVLTQKLQFKKLEGLLSVAEEKYGLNLVELKDKCEGANREVERLMEEYFKNPFFDSTLTESEEFIEETPWVPLQLAFHKVSSKVDPEKIRLTLEGDCKAKIKAPLQRDRFKAAIGLLLLNAIESLSGEGEVRVAGQTMGEEGGRRFEIAIEDTGRGIKEDVLPRIFEPLFKTLDKQGHMGIGLPFVKTIAEGHRGAIEIHSTSGKGTTARLSIPILNETD